MRIKITFCYDGSLFYGFEHQDNVRTIEDELLKAIRKVDKDVDKIYASGRTDRFVHAKGQVAHFDSNLAIKDFRWAKAINTYLPEDIRVLDSCFVSDDFHARHSVKEKEYHYLIRYKTYDIFKRNYFDFFTNLDFDLIENGLKKLLGVHDFRGFCSAKIHPLKPTIKDMKEAKMIIHDEYIELIFIASGFLKYQVRKMVGTLIDIAIGKKNLTIIDEIFAKKDPKLSNRVVSGHGLYLEKVVY